jgi:hypothetical protein
LKRPLSGAALLLIGATAASAAPATPAGPVVLDLTCDAPQIALGDDPRDTNPVVSVDVRYVVDEHQWRVIHHLRNGLIVSRSEQYAIQDVTNVSKVQWQGSLNRARQLYMIGEIRPDANGTLRYMEWMYDRSKGNALVMQASTRCARAVPQPTQPYSVQPTQPALPQPTAPEFLENQRL